MGQRLLGVGNYTSRCSSISAALLFFRASQVRMSSVLIVLKTKERSQEPLVSDVSMSPIGHPFNCQARLWLRWKLRQSESYSVRGTAPAVCCNM